MIQRSKELQLIDENGKCKVPKLDIGLRNCDRVEEITLSEIEDESKSASRSTTSDSQVRDCQFCIFFFLKGLLSQFNSVPCVIYAVDDRTYQPTQPHNTLSILFVDNCTVQSHS